LINNKNEIMKNKSLNLDLQANISNINSVFGFGAFALIIIILFEIINNQD